MSTLKAGASSGVITPPVGSHMAAFGLRKGLSRGIHDDLKARAVVMDDGTERIALVALDVVDVNAQLTTDIRNRIRQLTGIRESNVMVTTTHTHTSPFLGGGLSLWEDYAAESGYTKIFPEYVAGSVVAAEHSLEPCSVSSESCKLEGITTNRRHPEQPADTELSVLKISRATGKLLAMVINFACHPLIVGGQNLLWTADFPGFATSFVENSFPGSVCMFVQGAAGDVHPWDWYFANDHPKHKPTFEEAERFGTVLACEAIRTSEPATGVRKAELGVATKIIKLKKRKTPSEDEAEELLNSVLARHKPWNKDTWDADDYICTVFRKHPSQYLISSATALLEQSRDHADELTAELQAFKVGDTAIIGIPGEPFSNLGIETRKKSNARKTLYVGYANDMIGYIPTVEAHKECENVGYEEGFGLTYCYGAVLPVSVISKEGITKLTSSAVQLVNQLPWQKTLSA